MSAHVIVKTGPHQGGTGVAPLLPEFISADLQERGIEDGHYIFQLGPAIQGSRHSPRFRATELTSRKSVAIIVKPGTNGTARKGWLTPTNGTTLSPEELYAKLRDPHTAKPLK